MSTSHKHKEAIGRRQFNISSSEKLIDYCNCKYKSKLSAGGSLWLFSAHFCFYSNLFANETKIRIRLSDIIKVKSFGNTSIEIYNNKNKNKNNVQKFIGFPSTERRDLIIKYIQNNLSKINISSNINIKSPSASASKSINIIKNNELNDNKNDIKNDIKTSSSLQNSSNNHISPSNNATNLNTIHKTSHESFDPQNPSIIPRKNTISPVLSPNKLLTSNSYLNNDKVRRKSSGGVNYNNPPVFRLEPVVSQNKFSLITPKANSDDNDDELEQGLQLVNHKTNKECGTMDTLDILHLNRSNSLHSSPDLGRLRSYSDDERYKDENDDDNNDNGNDNNKHKSGIWSIFHPKHHHRKQNKIKAPPNNKALSLSQINKQSIQKELLEQSRSVPLHSRPDSPNPVASTPVDIIPQSVIQYIDEKHASSPHHIGSFSDLKFKQLYEDSFWSNVATFFHEAYSETFVKKLHHDRGSMNLQIGKWELDDDEKTLKDGSQPDTYMRKLEYTSKIKDPPPFMPAKTEVYETQRFRFYGSDCCVVDVSISTPNIKYGDYFLMITKYLFTKDPEDDNKTKMTAELAFNWAKKTWFEKIIVSKASSETQEGIALWASKLHLSFPPKQSYAAILQKQVSLKKNIDPNQDQSQSPKKRVIDKKIIDYFHTERKQKDIIIQDWIKPVFYLFIDIFSYIFNPKSWYNAFNLLYSNINNNTFEHHHIIFTLKHYILIILLLIATIIIFNIFWIFLFYWYNSSLNNVIKEQNEILKQQSKIFENLLTYLVNQNNNLTTDCNVDKLD